MSTATETKYVYRATLTYTSKDRWITHACAGRVGSSTEYAQPLRAALRLCSTLPITLSVVCSATSPEATLPNPSAINVSAPKSTKPSTELARRYAGTAFTWASTAATTVISSRATAVPRPAPFKWATGATTEPPSSPLPASTSASPSRFHSKASRETRSSTRECSNSASDRPSST